MIIISSLAFAACATVKGPFVWVDAYHEPAAATDPVILAGDEISVRVREDEKMSVKGRVRDDGRISVPLLNDVEVANQTPTQVARRLEDLLKAEKFLTVAHVSVVIEQTRPLTVSVLGAVARPGNYPLTPGAGVAEALASAGSLTDFAHRDQIFVLRRTPKPVRIRLTYAGITSSQGAGATFQLRPGDVIVVQ